MRLGTGATYILTEPDGLPDLVAEVRLQCPTSTGNVTSRCDSTSIVEKVEDTGLEPVTFWLPAKRSPN